MAAVELTTAVSGDKLAVTKLDVYNRALAHLGSIRLQLNDLNASNSTLDQLNLHYGFVGSELTRMHPWSCFTFYSSNIETDARQPLQANSHLAAYKTTDGLSGDNLEFFDQARFFDDGTGATDSVIVNGANPLTHNSVEAYVQNVIVTEGSDFALERGLVIKLMKDTPTENGSDGAEIKYRGQRWHDTFRDYPAYLIELFVVLLASKIAVPLIGSVEKQFELYKTFYENLLPEAKRLEALNKNDARIDNNNNPIQDEPFTFVTYEKA